MNVTAKFLPQAGITVNKLCYFTGLNKLNLIFNEFALVFMT